jgi:hypothetical protein
VDTAASDHCGATPLYAPSTVGLILRRNQLSKWRSLFEKEPVQRYEPAAPGDLVHLDTKKLVKIATIGHRIHGDPTTTQRGMGREVAHMAIDDYSQEAHGEVLPEETKATTTTFLQKSLMYFESRGTKI